MARDKFHYEVKQALVYDGWDVTDDPLYKKIGSIPIHIDLGVGLSYKKIFSKN